MKYCKQDEENKIQDKKILEKLIIKKIRNWNT